MKNLMIFMFVAVIFAACGDDGKSGLSALTSITAEESGENCENGGFKVETGLDESRDGTLDEDEVKDIKYICNGESGTDGTDGQDGEAGVDGQDGAAGDKGDPGEAGTDGVDGTDGACADNNVPEIEGIEINGTEYIGTPVETFDGVTVIEITATDADADDLVYVVTGSGAMIEQDETDKHKFTLTFNTARIYYFSVIVSDGCQVTVKSFAVESVCTVDIPNYHEGICWSAPASSEMTWSDATTYCEGLGGRLPKIQELRTLIQNCPETEYPQPDGQTDWCEIEDPDKLTEGDWSTDCYSYCSGDLNVFGDTEWFWSSSVYVDNTDNAWYVYFSNGRVLNTSKTSGRYAMCVR